MGSPDPDARPLIRMRVAIPAVLLLGATVAVYLMFGVTRSGPFGPLFSPPPPAWQPSQADEVTLWAYHEGIERYQAGAFDEAAALLGRAAGGVPSEPVPMFLAGVCHLLGGRPEAAVGLLGRAVDLAPDEPQYRYYLAWTEWQLEHPDAAQAQLERAAKGDDRWARRARKALGRMEP